MDYTGYFAFALYVSNKFANENGVLKHHYSYRLYFSKARIQNHTQMGNLDSENLKGNSESYIYRVKKILSDLKLRQAIFFISIKDERLKELSLKYDITKNCLDTFNQEYLVNENGNKRVERYNFHIMNHYE